MVKGIASFVHQLIAENKGSFEEEWANSISEYGVYGKTIKRKLYPSDGKERYFHLYDNSAKACSEKRELELTITEMKRFLMNHTNEKRSFGPAYEKYFLLHYDKDGETFLFPEDKSLRVYSDESAASKIFIEFIALILRCSIYTHLKDALKQMDHKPNYMTVPAAIRELKKIEMVRQLNDVYRLDHAVTAHQKVILEAFEINAEQVKYKASYISEELKR